MKKFKLIALGIAFSLTIFACGGNSNAPTDTPTTGDVNIIVDESFQQLFETQIYTFESFHRHANINVKYLSEGASLDLMIKDSCKVVVMCRDLTKAERANFKAHNIFPISTKIAEDAIAIIVNPANTDSVLSVNNIREILLGEDSTWAMINPNSNLNKIDVVFDNQGSANARYMQDSILKGKQFGSNVFAVKSNKQVIEYVSKHKNAIGFLSVNWISDMDDPQVQKFLNKIKVVAISKVEGGEYFKPFQAYIQTKEYPFTRNVYMINRQTRRGLGMGFVHFVADDKGQLIILKSGLIPAIAPVRLVEVTIG